MMASGPTLEKQIQDLLKQHKYTAAIRKLQQSLKREPNQTLTTTEADIRLLQGKHEFKQGQYAQAEATFQQVLEFGSPMKPTIGWLSAFWLKTKR